MFLREYVYVDIDRVAGLAAQLYDGVPERAINIVARQKRLDVDLKFLRGGGESGKEEQTERNLADSLFKDLEIDLESLGLLQDLSDELSRQGSWTDIEQLVSAGMILRITSQGTLFHPSQMSEAIVGMATAATGLSDVGLDSPDVAPALLLPPNAKSEAQKKAERSARQSALAGKDRRHPEDYLPDVGVIPLMNVDRKLLAGMIKVTRGIFSQGVHLQLRPLGVDGPTISARLEEGRRFLDSAPEVLLSRYGLAPQEWTAVGVVGQLGSPGVPEQVKDVTYPDGTVNRARFVDLVGSFLTAARGLIDVPLAPGFSLIPLAIYRSIGESVAAEGK